VGEQTNIVRWMALAHHPSSQLQRCVLLPVGKRRLAICARCLGLYPTLVVVIALQMALALGPMGLLDWWIALLGVLPAVVDWGLGRLECGQGSNRLRVMTGLIAGVAMGRSFFLYLRDPMHEIFWVQIVLLVMAALSFETVKRMDLKGPRPRKTN
jgi:uncharacterized membrane protein